MWVALKQLEKINDVPILLNQIDDIEFDEDLYFYPIEYEILNLNDNFIDVDKLIMSEESLNYQPSSSNEDFVVFVTEDSGNPMLSFYLNNSIFLISRSFFTK